VELAEQYAREIVALGPAVIVANGTPVIAALLMLTSSIPIVCAMVNDPVSLGFVKSLSQPGGNVTGFTFINPELIGKWMNLLKDSDPSLIRAALLFNPNTAFSDAHDDGDRPQIRLLLRACDERPGGRRATKRGNEFSPLDADYHVTLPWGSYNWRGRYHTWTCCTAGFQTGLCQLGVKTRCYRTATLAAASLQSTDIRSGSRNARERVIFGPTDLAAIVCLVSLLNAGIVSLHGRIWAKHAGTLRKIRRIFPGQHG
jgi:ABC transporter substrate binding protein